MSLNRWKTNKPSTKPQPIAKPERLTGGGEPSSIAKVATIAIAAGVIPEIFGEMPNDAEAKVAIAALNDMNTQGRKMTVNEAKPKGDRGSSHDRY